MGVGEQKRMNIIAIGQNFSIFFESYGLLNRALKLSRHAITVLRRDVIICY
jgi:hypothetical protein